MSQQHSDHCPDENASLSVKVYCTLKQRILRWEYLPGQRITEEEVCNEFGLSRSPVREALRTLVENGLMDKEHYRGYKVKDLDFQQLHELYEVRIALELFAVARAAESMPAEDWQRLYNFWSAVPDPIPTDGLDLTLEDEKFHETIAEAANNKTLLQYLRAIDERLRYLRMRDFTSPERVKETYQQHQLILKMIAERRGREAQEAMLTNIEMSQKNVETAAADALARAYMRRVMPER